MCGFLLYLFCYVFCATVLTISMENARRRGGQSVGSSPTHAPKHDRQQHRRQRGVQREPWQHTKAPCLLTGTLLRHTQHPPFDRLHDLPPQHRQPLLHVRRALAPAGSLLHPVHNLQVLHTGQTPPLARTDLGRGGRHPTQGVHETLAGRRQQPPPVAAQPLLLVRLVGDARVSKRNGAHVWVVLQVAVGHVEPRGEVCVVQHAQHRLIPPDRRTACAHVVLHPKGPCEVCVQHTQRRVHRRLLLRLQARLHRCPRPVPQTRVVRVAREQEAAQRLDALRTEAAAVRRVDDEGVAPGGARSLRVRRRVRNGAVGDEVACPDGVGVAEEHVERGGEQEVFDEAGAAVDERHVVGCLDVGGPKQAAADAAPPTGAPVRLALSLQQKLQVAVCCSVDCNDHIALEPDAPPAAVQVLHQPLLEVHVVSEHNRHQPLPRILLEHREVADGVLARREVVVRRVASCSLQRCRGTISARGFCGRTCCRPHPAQQQHENRRRRRCGTRCPRHRPTAASLMPTHLCERLVSLHQ
eukprot:Rhum_TRINITY_DN23145_c0_g1::Rhum_TRINITY_DN23145_c0_g1_i1::g.177251::m.177251